MNQTKFTRGPVKASGNAQLWFVGTNQTLRSESESIKAHESKAIAAIAECDEAKANTDLIVAAFNSATACADMGYDGIKAVEALPKLLEALNKIASLETLGSMTTAPRIAIEALAQAGQKQLSPQ